MMEPSMGGRGLGQPAAGREGMILTSTCDGEGGLQEGKCILKNIFTCIY